MGDPSMEDDKEKSIMDELEEEHEQRKVDIARRGTAGFHGRAPQRKGMDEEILARQRRLIESYQPPHGRRRVPDVFLQGKVVGVSFIDHYPDNLHRLRAADEQKDANGHPEPLPILLKRNPYNEYDCNAIEVHAPGLGSQGWIGHLPRDIAARVAPEMDHGVLWRAALVTVLVLPSKPNQPGCLIGMGRAADWEEFALQEGVFQPRITFENRIEAAFAGEHLVRDDTQPRYPHEEQWGVV